MLQKAEKPAPWRHTSVLSDGTSRVTSLGETYFLHVFLREPFALFGFMPGDTPLRVLLH